MHRDGVDYVLVLLVNRVNIASGMTSVHDLTGKALGQFTLTAPFDAALVDVPCSNTGVLGRRPEVRWRLRPGDFRHLVPLQTKLLIQAAERVRPGGAVVYSTCSVEPEENGGLARRVLRERPDVALEAEEETSPGLPSDGSYWARLRVRG